jgi:integrase
MGLYLGLRPGEVLARVARDVDVYAEGVRLWIDQGKTVNAQRYLDVPEPLASLLAARAKELEPNEPLFPGRYGRGILTARTLRRLVHKLCDEAGVPRVCPHALRGTHSTLARQGGASGAVVAAQLGHASEKITDQHYLAPGVKRRAEAKRFKLVAGGKK